MLLLSGSKNLQKSCLCPFCLLNQNQRKLCGGLQLHKCHIILIRVFQRNRTNRIQTETLNPFTHPSIHLSIKRNFKELAHMLAEFGNPKSAEQTRKMETEGRIVVWAQRSSNYRIPSHSESFSLWVY